MPIPHKPNPPNQPRSTKNKKQLRTQETNPIPIEFSNQTHIQIKRRSYSLWLCWARQKLKLRLLLALVGQQIITQTVWNLINNFNISMSVTINFLINWSSSESNTQVNPTTCLGDTGCWIQQVTVPALVVTWWIHQCASILNSSWTGGALPPRYK